MTNQEGDMRETNTRHTTEEVFLDAAERLLIEIGYARITTRRLGEEAGANHGLIHYYFGSMEQLFVRVLERYTERLIERQRAMYAAPVPFRQKWRMAMRYLDADRESGYQKIWYELQALAWNRPELRDRVACVRRQWSEVLNGAFTQAAEEYGLDTRQFSGKALAVLVGTFNEGIMLERLSGIYDGHAELLAMIDSWLESLEVAKIRRAESDESAIS
jgi:AcrR family transcriptional regulator